MKISGVYQIQSRLKPSRIYIGSTNNIQLRWKRHIYDLLTNKHRSKKLQNHFNKYGEFDLQFSILLGCEIEELLKAEQYFIDSINPWFNNAKIAGSPMLGHHHSELSKLKMSEKAMGNKYSVGRKNSLGIKQSPETIAKRVAKTTGKKRTEETKLKMSAWQKGKPKSEEARRNMSKAQQGHKGHTPWNKGKPAWNRGKSPSDEQKRKRRETMQRKKELQC